MNGIIIAFSVTIILLASSSSALAKTPAVILNFEGPSAARIRQAALTGLRKQVALADRKAFTAGTPSLQSDADYVSGARAAGVHAIIEGSVQRQKGLWVATISVRGGDGAVIDEMVAQSRSATRLAAQVQRTIWGELADGINNAKPAEALPPVPAEPATPLASGDVTMVPSERPRADEAQDTVEPESVAWPRPHPLTVGGYLRAFNRNLSYDDLPAGGQGLREYNLPLGPALELAATWYPAAHYTSGWVTNLAVEVAFSQAFALDSNDCRPAFDARGDCTAPAEQVAFPTSSNSYSVGGRFRVPFSNAEPYAQLAYGGHSFGTSGGNEAEPGIEMPDVAYSFVRLGGGARFSVGQVMVEPRLGYLLLLGLGEFESAEWFPASSGSAIEAMLRVGYPLTDSIELQASFNYQAYSLSISGDPDPNVSRSAGGASDRYISGSVGLSYEIPLSLQ